VMGQTTLRSASQAGPLSSWSWQLDEEECCSLCKDSSPLLVRHCLRVFGLPDARDPSKVARPGIIRGRGI
jgi:hypothetical protein